MPPRCYLRPLRARCAAAAQGARRRSAWGAAIERRRRAPSRRAPRARQTRPRALGSSRGRINGSGSARLVARRLQWHRSRRTLCAAGARACEGGAAGRARRGDAASRRLRVAPRLHGGCSLWWSWRADA
eukprot:2092725-Prymnesium_polylepis.2